MTKAAEKAGISPSRWRSIENGWRWESKGKAVVEHAPAATLAKVADFLGITPAQLRQVGRADAAQELHITIEHRRSFDNIDLSEVPHSELLAELGRRLDDATGVASPPVTLRAVARRGNPADSSLFESE